MATIEFATSPSVWRVASPPYRAAKALPRWWQELQKELPSDGFPRHTIKACTPVFDALTAGYIIPLPFDLHVKARGDEILFTWRFAPDVYIEQHPVEQVPIYGGAWKLINPWVIKTEPGVSVMIVHPMHRPELPFHTLEAVVDTDTYHNNVNFPFRWTGGDYDGVLRAGTPFAQVIPFRREPWTMSAHAMTDEELVNRNRHHDRVSAHEHSYRRSNHRPKTYRQEKADA